MERRLTGSTLFELWAEIETAPKEWRDGISIGIQCNGGGGVYCSEYDEWKTVIFKKVEGYVVIPISTAGYECCINLGVGGGVSNKRSETTRSTPTKPCRNDRRVDVAERSGGVVGRRNSYDKRGFLCENKIGLDRIQPTRRAREISAPGLIIIVVFSARDSVNTPQCKHVYLSIKIIMNTMPFRLRATQL